MIEEFGDQGSESYSLMHLLCLITSEQMSPWNMIRLRFSIPIASPLSGLYTLIRYKLLINARSSFLKGCVISQIDPSIVYQDSDWVLKKQFRRINTEKDYLFPQVDKKYTIFCLGTWGYCWGIPLLLMAQCAAAVGDADCALGGGKWLEPQP